jgi:hypothetical protein
VLPSLCYGFNLRFYVGLGLGFVSRQRMWLDREQSSQAITASDGYEDRTVFEKWLRVSLSVLPILTYLLNPRSRVFLKKPHGSKIVNKYPAMF